MLKRNLTACFFILCTAFAKAEEQPADKLALISKLLTKAEALQQQAINLSASALNENFKQDIKGKKALKIFIAYEDGDYFKPQIIKLLINDKPVITKRYKKYEIQALQKGAIDLIYEDYIPLTSNRITAEIFGTNGNEQLISFLSKSDIENESGNIINKKIKVTINKSTYRPKAEWTSWK